MKTYNVRKSLVDMLSIFVLSLGHGVDWSGSTQTCLDDISKALSKLYMIRPATNGTEFDCLSVSNEMKSMLAFLRTHFNPSIHRSNGGSIIELTRLEQLYRVFERC